MALSQEEYQKYLEQAKELGLEPNPDLKPISAPVGAPVQQPVQAPQPAATPVQPVPTEQSFMDSFKQDYARIQQGMREAPSVSNRISPVLVEALPDIGEMSGTMAGMYYGAQQGASLTKNPYGTAMFGLFGAMLGSGSGEAVKQMFKNEFDPAKVIDTMLVSGMFTAGFEGLGKMFELAKTGLSKIRGGKDIPSLDEIGAVDELVKELEKVGITMTPAQLTGSNFQRTLEKVGKAGFGGEQQFADLYLAQDKFMADRLEALTKQVGNPNRKQTGDLLKQALEDADRDLLTWAEPKYSAINKAARGEPVSLQSTLQSLRHKIAVGQQGRREGAKGVLDPEVQELYQFVLGNVQNTDFKQWFDLIKRLNSDHRKVLSRLDNKNPTLEKAYADVFQLLYKDAEKAASKYGSEVLQQFKDVTKVVRTSKETLNDSAIKMLSKTQPEFAGERIYSVGSVSSVEAAFKALDEAAVNAQRVGKTFDAEAAKADLRAGYLEALFTKTELADTSAQQSVKLLEQIIRDPKTKDTFEAMLPPKLQSEVKKVLGWGYQLEKNSAGNFSLIVRGRQSGELNRFANQMSGNDAAGLAITTIVKSLATITGPQFLAKRAVSGKATNKYLSQLKDVVTKFDSGDLTKTDAATLLGLWATNVSPDEKLPQELQVPNLTPEESLKMHEARLKAEATLERAGITNSSL